LIADFGKACIRLDWLDISKTVNCFKIATYNSLRFGIRSQSITDLRYRETNRGLNVTLEIDIYVTRWNNSAVCVRFSEAVLVEQKKRICVSSTCTARGVDPYISRQIEFFASDGVEAMIPVSITSEHLQLIRHFSAKLRLVVADH